MGWAIYVPASAGAEPGRRKKIRRACAKLAEVISYVADKRGGLIAQNIAEHCCLRHHFDCRFFHRKRHGGVLNGTGASIFPLGYTDPSRRKGRSQRGEKEREKRTLSFPNGADSPLRVPLRREREGGDALDLRRGK